MTLDNILRQIKIKELEITNITHSNTIHLIEEKIKVLNLNINRYNNYITNNNNKIEEIKKKINPPEQT